MRPTPEVLEAIKKLKTRFPTFDPDELLVTGQDPFEYNHDLHADLGGSDLRQLALWQPCQVSA